jgi:transposase
VASSLRWRAMVRQRRVTRRANALMLLDGGWSCQEVADALLMNDDTIRGWHKLFEQRGIEGLTSFDVGGSAGFLSAAQEHALQAFVGTTPPRSTRQIGDFIEREFGLVYESRSGLIALLHRLELEYHQPEGARLLIMNQATAIWVKRCLTQRES